MKKKDSVKRGNKPLLSQKQIREARRKRKEAGSGVDAPPQRCVFEIYPLRELQKLTDKVLGVGKYIVGFQSTDGIDSAYLESSETGEVIILIRDEHCKELLWATLIEKSAIRRGYRPMAKKL